MTSNQHHFVMLPSIENEEWLKIVTGSVNPQIHSHLLKIKIATLKQKVKRKMITPEEAVRELYGDCVRHQDIYQKDLHQIFKKEKNRSL